MRKYLKERVKYSIKYYSSIFQDSLIALFILFFVTALAYEYDILPDEPHIYLLGGLDFDEAFALGGLVCVGLLILSWRLLRLQRREVVRRIKAEQLARELAHQDSLTGLSNRRQFDQEMKIALAALPRTDGAHAVLLLDLNHFKRINDVFGHGVGDEVLINVAARLQRILRTGDHVARLGGDEFAILAPQLSGAEEATGIALRVIKELEQPIKIGATRHQIGVGIGVALIPQDGRDESEIMRKADIALYRAKAERDSALCFFEPAMDARIRERDLIERELGAAIANGDLQPYYQPLIDLVTQKIIGFEALARWTHPTLGSLPPDRFIPIAESCGLMDELTDALLRQAALTARQWPEDITLAFNISPSQLKDGTLGLRILAILGKSGLSPRRLEIEITEAALVQDIHGAQQVVGCLREAGVRIALDDFGTGYSSLYHLRNFKVDKIKIDRSFVDGMDSDPEASALVRGLLGLSHGLGLIVTAEGVEHPGQAATLLEQGCEQAQGYLYGRAMPATDAIKLVTAQAEQSAGPIARVA